MLSNFLVSLLRKNIFFFDILLNQFNWKSCFKRCLSYLQVGLFFSTQAIWNNRSKPDPAALTVVNTKRNPSCFNSNWTFATTMTTVHDSRLTFHAHWNASVKFICPWSFARFSFKNEFVVNTIWILQKHEIRIKKSCVSKNSFATILIQDYWYDLTQVYHELSLVNAIQHKRDAKTTQVKTSKSWTSTCTTLVDKSETRDDTSWHKSIYLSKSATQINSSQIELKNIKVTHHLTWLHVWNELISRDTYKS